MNAQEFKHILEIGLGRAILYLQKHDAAPYRQIILNACLHTTAYDRQVEGSRAPYLFEIIALTGEKKFYRDHILQGLKGLSETSDHWDVDDLYKFAVLFALEGDIDAKQVIYEKFLVEPALADYESSSAVVQVGGLDGLLLIANRLGRDDLSHLEDDGYHFRNLLDGFENEYSQQEIFAFLEKHAAENASITNYLSVMRYALREKPPREKNASSSTMSYEEIKPLIFVRKNPPRYSHPELRYWGKSASEEDFLKAAEDFLVEEDEERLAGYLRIFWKRPFPLDPSKLIMLTQIAEPRLAHQTITVLANVVHPAVRAYALQLAGASKDVDWAARLLVNNYQAGDWVLFKSLSERELDRDEIHGLGFPIEDVFKQHPSEEGASALLNLYEKCPCSACRERMVRLLYAANRLPAEILEECKFDANFDLREAARNNFPDLRRESRLLI